MVEQPSGPVKKRRKQVKSPATGIIAEGWKVFRDGEDVEHVPLWKALAKFTSENLNEGLQINGEVTNRERSASLRDYNVTSVISFSAGVLFLVTLLVGFPLAVRLGSAGWLMVAMLILFLGALAPQVRRWCYQYGWKRLRGVQPLPHEPDPYFDEFLSYLQQADCPEVYYLSRFRKKRKVLSRQHFFGKLRYLLFSEASDDRVMVMRCHYPRSLPSDIFLCRHDVERIIALSNPNRKARSGTYAKYPYEDAMAGVLGDPRLLRLGLGDRDQAIKIIAGWVVEWFREHDPDRAPRSDYDRVQDVARKIYGLMKIFRPLMAG